MHRSRALAGASAALLLLATSARGGVQPPVRGMVASLFGAILSLMANAASADEPLKLPDSQLEPAKWTEVAGWTADDHLAAFAAYQTGCQALRKTRQTDGGKPLGHCGTSAAKP